MQAAIYYGEAGIVVEKRPLPTIGPADVLVKTLFAGLCGTDLNIVRAGAVDRGIRAGSEFGHELVGQVGQVGGAVPPGLREGLLVGVNPITAKRACRREALQCGGFSQYIRVEDARLGDNLFAISPAVPLEQAALLEPLSVGRHGAWQVRPQPHEKLVVLGAGPIGLAAAACPLAEGMTQVCVVDVDDTRQAAARALGASTIHHGQQPLAAGLAERFDTVDVYGQALPDVDALVDAAGAPALVQQVVALAKPRARLAIIAVCQHEVPVSLAHVMSKELVLTGASGYTPADIERVVAHLHAATLPLGVLVSRGFPLADITQAFATAIADKGVIKVLVDMR